MKVIQLLDIQDLSNC